MLDCVSGVDSQNLLYSGFPLCVRACWCFLVLQWSFKKERMLPIAASYTPLSEEVMAHTETFLLVPSRQSMETNSPSSDTTISSSVWCTTFQVVWASAKTDLAIWSAVLDVGSCSTSADVQPPVDSMDGTGWVDAWFAGGWLHVTSPPPAVPPSPLAAASCPITSSNLALLSNAATIAL